MSTLEGPSMLALLQLADSQFPSGSFAHSYGLEQLAREGWLATPIDVEAYVCSVVAHQVATSDARVAEAAARAASRGSTQALFDLDESLLLTKAAAESRQASTTLGRRLLEEVAAHPEASSPALAAFLAAVRSGSTPGTHPVAFGLAGAALGISPDAAGAALIFATASAMLSASMRLLPVSHRDVQGALHRLRPLIEALIEALLKARPRDALDPAGESPPPLLSFHPLQEIAAMRHATSSVRLFAS